MSLWTKWVLKINRNCLFPSHHPLPWPFSSPSRSLFLSLFPHFLSNSTCYEVPTFFPCRLALSSQHSAAFPVMLSEAMIYIRPTNEKQARSSAVEGGCPGTTIPSSCSNAWKVLLTTFACEDLVKFGIQDVLAWHPRMERQRLLQA
jgi:hypothetical protein